MPGDSHCGDFKRKTFNIFQNSYPNLIYLIPPELVE